MSNGERGQSTIGVLHAGQAASGGAPQPLAQLKAEDFACGAATGGFPFGIDRARAASAFRKLADNIEAGIVNPVRVHVDAEGSAYDFQETALHFVYNERSLVPVPQRCSFAVQLRPMLGGTPTRAHCHEAEGHSGEHVFVTLAV